MTWDELRPGDELADRFGFFERHFIVLARNGNVLTLYSFTLDQLVCNRIEGVDDFQPDELFIVTRHA